VTAVTFNQVTWYTLENVNPEADFIITISGTDDIVFNGEPFPAPAGRVAFNIPGQRMVVANTGVNGTILAPDATFFQTTGIVHGFVITGSVKNLRQINKLNCLGCIMGE